MQLNGVYWLLVELFEQRAEAKFDIKKTGSLLSLTIAQDRQFLSIYVSYSSYLET